VAESAYHSALAARLVLAMGNSSSTVGSLAVRGKKRSPTAAGDFSQDGASAQEQDEDDERDRDPDEPEKNGHGVLLIRVAS
jgi:hypothetical protein